MKKLKVKMIGISGNINNSESNEVITLQELKASNEVLREKLAKEEKKVEVLVKECAFYNNLVFEYKIANRKMKSELEELEELKQINENLVR